MIEKNELACCVVLGDRLRGRGVCLGAKCAPLPGVPALAGGSRAGERPYLRSRREAYGLHSVSRGPVAFGWDFK